MKLKLVQLDLYNSEQCYKQFRVCSAHFEEQMFSSIQKNRLKRNAVPTIFEYAIHTSEESGESSGKYEFYHNNSGFLIKTNMSSSLSVLYCEMAHWKACLWIVLIEQCNHNSFYFLYWFFSEECGVTCHWMVLKFDIFVSLLTLEIFWKIV